MHHQSSSSSSSLNYIKQSLFWLQIMTLALKMGEILLCQLA
jgi:hypothetical protein